MTTPPPAEPTPAPGSRMDAEMREQPRVLAALAARAPEVARAVAAVAPPRPAGTVLVARGSSDHAAVYARYVLEVATGRPVALAAPSLHTRYRVDVDLDGWVAVGVSQSGRTPEIVATLDALGRAGAVTVALTNVADSPLAKGAHAAVVLGAGEERAVPATKTFTAQLAASAHVAAGLGHTGWDVDDWRAVVDGVAAVLDDPGPVEQLADELVGAPPLLVVARGYLYAAALETALKVAETTGSQASGWSSADLLHGPIAVAEPGRHALCLAAPGPVAGDVAGVARDLAARGVRVHGVAGRADLLPVDGVLLPVPLDVPEPLAPLVQVVRGQQLARALALRLGEDPDRPRGLRKVTPTT